MDQVALLKQEESAHLSVILRLQLLKGMIKISSCYGWMLSLPGFIQNKLCDLFL
jgi:hypothetical protein